MLREIQPTTLKYLESDPKVDEIWQLALNLQIGGSVFTLSETWLDSTVENSEIAIDGYQVMRKDRNRHGSGVLAFVPVSTKTVRRHDLESDGVEILWLELKPNKDRKVLMAVIYRPPGCGALDFFQIITAGIEKSLLENKEVTLIGDLNCNMLTSNPLSDKM